MREVVAECRYLRADCTRLHAKRAK